ncbi:hypothetical protein PISMIDRAFT_432040 [Pisolithus microcarpus 441]|uniref:Unplaced genomic scaffold scaffold_38, whole genome shotgun sequence n=1 Tax=Pisolithus microcarpus 441 TaxID=765257 RepID=A0A0C9ZD66_9AGAM|nr:hypothetical protein BKA83DRAFT_432040 [Pisolithus microcarpus]KIK23874.1 hypothetical protein PISMIDRAFT_432040 [Pisolithus microcarpus 441]
MRGLPLLSCSLPISDPHSCQCTHTHNGPCPPISSSTRSLKQFIIIKRGYEDDRGSRQRSFNRTAIRSWMQGNAVLGFARQGHHIDQATAQPSTPHKSAAKHLLRAVLKHQRSEPLRDNSQAEIIYRS